MSNQASHMILHTAGGRVPFSVMRRVAELAMVYGNGNVRFGSRQELILCAIPGASRDRVRRDLGTLLVEHHPKRPNIVTTRPVSGRADRTPWLGDGTYDAVLGSFLSPPAMPVSLSDPRQSYLPLYTGQINFLATNEPGFWQVAFHAKGQLRPIVLSQAVHSEGVPAATFVIQQALLRDNALDLPELQRNLEECLGSLLREVASNPSAIHEDIRPITGFELDEKSDCYTLGIPVLGQALPGQFLVDLGLLARQESIGTAGITPWQSLIVHGIPLHARPEFERLLLRHRISINTGGWDSVCFNDWRSPHVARAGQDLITALNKKYPHPGELRIGLTEVGVIVPDTSIVVRADLLPARWPARPRPQFTVYAREKFERFNPMLIPTASGIGLERLADAVLDLVERYGAGYLTSAPTPAAVLSPRGGGLLVHQCMECQTEYSEQYGDPLGGIEAGTPFEELPSDWHCPTCGAAASNYITTRGHAA